MAVVGSCKARCAWEKANKIKSKTGVYDLVVRHFRSNRQATPLSYFLTHRSVLITHFSPAVTSLPSCYRRGMLVHGALKKKKRKVNSQACSRPRVYAEAAFPSPGSRRSPLSWSAYREDRRRSHRPHSLQQTRSGIGEASRLFWRAFDCRLWDLLRLHCSSHRLVHEVSSISKSVFIFLFLYLLLFPPFSLFFLSFGCVREREDAINPIVCVLRDYYVIGSSIFPFNNLCVCWCLTK